MSDRVVIKSDGAQPFRVSSVGVDAETAEFQDLLFDGNQSPLRIHQVGYVSVLSLRKPNLAPAFVSSIAIDPLPGYPLFSVMLREDEPYGVGACRCVYRNGPGEYGGGGVANPNTFYAITWRRTNGVPGTDPPPQTNYINFVLFKNYLP